MSMRTRFRKFLRARRPSHTTADFRRRRPELAEVIEDVLSRRLTYLSADALQDLADVVADAEAADLAGVLVEAGTALGGSAVVLGRSKSPTRPLLLFDVFGTIPPPSEHDDADVHQRYQRIVDGQAVGIGGDAYYGYRDDLRSVVADNLASFGLETESNRIGFVQGLYEQTMPVEEPVAIAHIDCDWYESVRTCLEGIAPSLVPGGRLVIDDYDAWSGCRRAVDEFLAGPGGQRFRPERRARLHLVFDS